MACRGVAHVVHVDFMDAGQMGQDHRLLAVAES